MSDKARIAAYNSVKRIFNGAYSNLITFGDGLSGLDRAFAENIILGTLERRITLEFILEKLVQKKPGEDVFVLLMTGVYQIFYMDKVPESAACNETVKIAKEIFGSKTAGFVNAVLRNACRNKEKIESDIANADEHIRYSADKDLVALIKSQYSDQTEDIFNAFFGKNPIFVRVNTLRTNAEAVAEMIGGTVLNADSVVTENASDVLREIKNGEFYIQGLASQSAVKLLGAMPGETVIDVCACPGGKTLGAAIEIKNEGRIYSFDLHANKLPLIEKSAKNLGVTIIHTEKHDAKAPKEELIGKADKVICDVPCSGTGVMGSKPEIKYKSPKDFEGLYSTQKAIIAAASRYLKKGGAMVYSTCSINKKENEEIVRNFISKNTNYKLMFEKTCLPFEEEREGFYMAKIVREK